MFEDENEDRVTDVEVAELVRDAFENQDGFSLRSVRSFEDAAVMTTNQGVVVTFADGTEFQVTVVRSR